MVHNAQVSLSPRQLRFLLCAVYLNECAPGVMTTVDVDVDVGVGVLLLVVFTPSARDS